VTPRQRNWLLILGVVVMILLAQRLLPPTGVSSSYADGPRPVVIAHQDAGGWRRW